MIRRTCFNYGPCCFATLCLLIGMGCIGGSIYGIIKFSGDNDGQKATYIAKQKELWTNTEASVTAYTKTIAMQCDIENCICAEASNSTSSCSAMKTNLQPGNCYMGYRCCAQTCETCYLKCTDYSSCKKYKNNSCIEYNTKNCYPYNCNCRCSNYVNRETCEVTCGPVTTINMLFSFTAVNGFTYSFTEQATCGKNNVICVQNYDANRNIGYHKTIWYKKQNPQSYWTSSPDYSDGYSPSEDVAGGIAGTSIAMIVSLICTCCCCVLCGASMSPEFISSQNKECDIIEAEIKAEKEKKRIEKAKKEQQERLEKAKKEEQKKAEKAMKDANKGIENTSIVISTGAKTAVIELPSNIKDGGVIYLPENVMYSHDDKNNRGTSV